LLLITLSNLHGREKKILTVPSESISYTEKKGID